MAEAPDGALRPAVLRAVTWLDQRGLNRGSTGNVSVRQAWHRTDGTVPGLWITPTGMGAEGLTEDDLVWIGADGQRVGRWLPSSEWHFHEALYRARPELNAVVHTHSTHATALACLQRRLPPFHYMVAVAGGDDVPLVPYHVFGSTALSDAIAVAMAGRQACLLAHHGLVAAGRDLAQALKITQEIEALCQAYLLALSVEEPPWLSQEQMAQVLEKFRHYGQGARSTSG